MGSKILTGLFKQLRKGFTLSEILVCLLIIGIVASLGIPILMQNAVNSTCKATFRKTYIDLAQALMLMASDNKGTVKDIFIDYGYFVNNLAKYVKAIKICGTPGEMPNDLQMAPCWNEKYPPVGCGVKAYGTSTILYNESCYGGMVLSNGAYIDEISIPAETDPSGNEACKLDPAKPCMDLYVDVNGNKPPNTMGKDIYFISVMSDGRLQLPTIADCKAGGEGKGCGARWMQTNYDQDGKE